MTMTSRVVAGRKARQCIAEQRLAQPSGRGRPHAARWCADRATGRCSAAICASRSSPGTRRWTVAAWRVMVTAHEPPPNSSYTSFHGRHRKPHHGFLLVECSLDGVDGGTGGWPVPEGPGRCAVVEVFPFELQESKLTQQRRALCVGDATVDDSRRCVAAIRWTSCTVISSAAGVCSGAWTVLRHPLEQHTRSQTFADRRTPARAGASAPEGAGLSAIDSRVPSC